jgi:hypothetical protein
LYICIIEYLFIIVYAYLSSLHYIAGIQLGDVLGEMAGEMAGPRAVAPAASSGPSASQQYIDNKAKLKEQQETTTTR